MNQEILDNCVKYSYLTCVIPKKLLFVLTFFLSITLSAKQITVTSGADSGIGSLREAIEKANPNDTIVFADSITTISFIYGIDLDKNITIQGNQTENTIITCIWRHFYIPIADTPEKAVKVTLNNLTLKDGYAPTCGGAIFNREGGNLLILNHCQFINNSAGETCGAIDNHSKLIVNDCLFNKNFCNGTGVGAILNSDELYITNSLFINNKTSDNFSAGALYNYNSGKMKIINSIFIENNGINSVLLNRGQATFLNCQLVGNSSTRVIYNFINPKYDLKKSFLKIINTTIVDNIGEGIYSEQELIILNSIIWNNNAENDIKITNDSSTSITYSLIGTSNFNIEGNHNIVNQNPLFVGNGNYQLKESSPAKDAGNNTLYPYTEYPKDLLGKNRISNTTIDMGAYEYQTEVPADTIITITDRELYIDVDSSTQKLTAIVTPENQAVIWNSLNNNIASVDANGNVTAIAKGETKIIATAGTVHDTCMIIVTDKMGVGIVNAENRAIVIYPNPVKEALYIQTTEKINNITIIDIDGHIVKQLAKYNGSISVSELPSGVYFIRIQTMNGDTTQRFVKK